MRFSEYFGLDVSQSQLDFVDVPLETDIPLFIDPYLVATAGTPFTDGCHQTAKKFFQEVLDKLRSRERGNARDLVNALREDNRTRLGYSVDQPKGTGLGPDRVGPFLDSLQNSPAFSSGQIEDIEEIALLVDRVDRDIVSDIMTNILRRELVDYTLEQCKLFGIAADQNERIREWAPGKGWVNSRCMLPSYEGRAILLVPRSVVCKTLALTPYRYVTSLLDDFDRGQRSALDSLSEMLRLPVKESGKASRGMARQAIDELGPKKSTLSRIATRDSLDRFKKQMRRNKVPLPADQIESLQEHGKPKVRDEIAEEMVIAATGASSTMDASASLASGLLAALHPAIQHPRRVDAEIPDTAAIRFANCATHPFLVKARRENPNILVLAVSKRIDSSYLESLDCGQIMNESEAGLMIVVGLERPHALRSVYPQCL